jgi:hypothetical protein
MTIEIAKEARKQRCSRSSAGSGRARREDRQHRRLALLGSSRGDRPSSTTARRRRAGRSRAHRELDIEFHEDEFDYWRKVQKAKKGR